MPIQIEKARAFRALYEHSGTFVIPNPRGPGSVRLLASVGFETLVSTSAGFALSRGLPDYGVGRDTILAHVADLTAATDVPMAVSLGNSFGNVPETVAETIRLTGATGIVGGSIEDATGRADASIYSLEASVNHVCVTVGVARALPFPLTPTAHSENCPHGCNDLADTIRYLQAFQDADADVLYVPGLKTRDETTTVLHEVDRPFNVLMGFADDNLSVAELTELGARRISIGTMPTRVVMGTLMRTAEEPRIAGTFSFARDAISGARLNGLFAPLA